ncbi:MAG: T9SS type A sorting domain-containing protein [Bacteroidota bacterium]
MKKLFLLVVCLLTSAALWAQEVQREMVVLEITTSTYCTYCPGAAMGAEDLLNNGKFVAVIEHHNSWQGNDPFDTPASNARSNTLAPGGNPGAFFDVKLKLVGGNHTTSMYPQYLPKYNTRIAKTSPLVLTMDVTNTGLDYTANIKMVKVGDITSTNLRMMFVVTQSHIAYNWQGQTKLNYVNRLMLPDANGTVVDFTSGDTVNVSMPFSLDPTWPAEDCEIIAFVEDMTGKEVLNGMKKATIDLQPNFEVTGTDFVINQPVTFTNTTTGGYMDTPETYQWSFPGATPDTSTQANPTVTYADSGAYDVTLIVNRGGQVVTLTKTAYVHVLYPVGVQENQILLSTKVSPNPSKGVFTLDVFCGKQLTVNVSVVNAINMPVFQENGISFKNHLTKTIDLGNVAKGIYFVVVEQDGSKTVQKVIVN